MSIYFWFQFALLIAFLFISAPRGGMFLGLFSGTFGRKYRQWFRRRLHCR